MVVVIIYPELYLFPYLIDVLENIFSEHSSAISSVDFFCESDLGRFARLKIFKLDIFHQTPFFGDIGVADASLALNETSIEILDQSAEVLQIFLHDSTRRFIKTYNPIVVSNNSMYVIPYLV
jgi:hypothetical protein